MTLEEARVILLRAFERTDEITPEMAILLIAMAEKKARRTPWWKRIFGYV